MIDGLCIFEAAQDAGGRTALCVNRRRFSFGELAERVRARLREPDLAEGRRGLFALEGSNTLETVVSLYALLQAGVPALLLHPRQTGSERAAVLDAVRRPGAEVPAHAVAIALAGAYLWGPASRCQSSGDYPWSPAARAQPGEMSGSCRSWATADGRQRE